MPNFLRLMRDQRGTLPVRQGRQQASWVGEEGKRYWPGYDFPMTRSQYEKIEEARGQAAANRNRQRAAIEGMDIPTVEDATRQAMEGWVPVQVYGEKWERFQDGPEARHHFALTWQPRDISDEDYTGYYGPDSDKTVWDLEESDPERQRAEQRYQDWLKEGAWYNTGRRELLAEYRVPQEGVDQLLNSEAFNRGDFTYTTAWHDGNLHIDTKPRGMGHDMGNLDPLYTALEDMGNQINQNVRQQAEGAIAEAEGVKERSLAEIAAGADEEAAQIAAAGQTYQDRSARARQTALAL